MWKPARGAGARAGAPLARAARRAKPRPGGRCPVSCRPGSHAARRTRAAWALPARPSGPPLELDHVVLGIRDAPHELGQRVISFEHLRPEVPLVVVSPHAGDDVPQDALTD